MIYFTYLETETERTAFEQFYRENERYCYRAALKITHNHHLAEECVHSAFLCAIKHKQKLFSLPGSKTRPWIVIIVKNTAINAVKAEARRAHTPVEDVQIADTSPSVDETVISADAHARLVEAIEALPEIYRGAFELKYLMFFTDAEIADMLGITVKTARQRIFRAKLKLREVIFNES